MENSPKSGESSRLSPAFHLNDFSLNLPVVSSTSQQISPSVSRLSEPLKRNGKLVRPSTASAAEEKSTLLPLAPSVAIVDVTTPDSKAREQSEVLHEGNSYTIQDDETKLTPVKCVISEGGSQATLG